MPKIDLHSKLPLDSPNGQALLVVEYFPEDISLQCPGYYSYYSNAGLAHPDLDPFRQGVSICQHSKRFLYLAYGFDTYVHASLPQADLHEYVLQLMTLGYLIVDSTDFDRNFLSFKRSYSLEDYFLVNDGTPEFTARSRRPGYPGAGFCLGRPRETAATKRQPPPRRRSPRRRPAKSGLDG